MRKILMILILPLLFVPVVFGAEGVVAVINNEVITSQELKEYLKVAKYKTAIQNENQDILKKEYTEAEKNAALNKLIEDKLIVQEAIDKGMQVPAQLVEKRLQEFIAKFNTKEEFEKSLSQRGISVSDLKNKIKEKALRKQLINDEVRRKVKVYPEEITAFYEKYKDKFVSSAAVKYKGLQFAQQSKAYEVYEELERSHDRAYIFGKYPDNITKGVLYEKQARPELKVLFSQDPGKVVAPITIEDSYYIFMIEEKKPPKNLSLQEAKNKIWSIVYQQKLSNEFNDWMEKLKDKAVIRVLLDSKSGF